MAMCSTGRAWFWRVAVFLAEAAYMLLELLAARTLAPTFGTTLDVWTSVIGCVLLASAVGNWIGGKLSDRPWLPVLALSLTGVICALVPGFAASAPAVKAFVGGSGTAGALAMSFLLFFLPCIGAGILPPYAMVAASDTTGSVGKAAGGMYAAATLGGLAGTFLGGFWLIPAFGTSLLTYCVALAYGAIAMACWVVASIGGQSPSKRWFGLSVAAIALAVASMASTTALSGAVSENGPVSFTQDTRYGHVTVYDDGDLRRMNVDGGFESAMWLGAGRESEPVFEYVRCIEELAEPRLQDDGTSVLCFGGAAYQLPKHLLDNTSATVEVCEIDDGVTEIAREWFALDEVDARNPGRLDVHHVDGRVFVNDAQAGTYDVVVNDTFAGNTPARVLATKEAAEAIRASMKPDGVYLTNIIGDVDNPDAFMRHELATLSEVFDDVVLVNPYKTSGNLGGTRCNWIVACGDDVRAKLPQNAGFHQMPDLDGVEVLTDDWCPVEAITAVERQQ